MNKPLFRILHTEWSDGFGGQERRVLSEMEGMRARGHFVCLATRQETVLREKISALNIPVLTLPFAGKFDLFSIFPLAKYIRDNQIQIVNTHSGIDSWVGAFAAKLAGAKLVRTRHLDIPLHRHIFNFVHFMADKLVTCGKETRRKLIEECGFPEAQIESIPTGIDFDHFVAKRTRAEMREDLGISEAAFVIVMVGVIRAVKRHETALRAFAKLYQQFPTSVLLLAGEGPMRGNMEDLSRQLNIDKSVYFLGQRSDIPDLLAAADCALLTSRSEGVPQAVTQGLGLGIPTIASNIGGIPELIEDQKSGVLVAVDDIEAIVSALARFINFPEEAKKLGITGQAHVLTHFSQKNMLDKTEALYDALLKRL